MRLDEGAARARFAAARVARLASADAAARPHLVPIVFALSGADVVYSAVDTKPKSTTALRRLRNVAANPAVCVLADHYAEDWSQLWWVRADGAGRVVTDPVEADAALALLRARYPVYVDDPPPGPVLAIDVSAWTGWSAR